MSRIPPMLLLAAAVAGLCIYGGMRAPWTTLDECLSAPSLHDGELITTPHEALIGRVMDGGFTLQWDGREITVRGSAPELKPGTYVRLNAIFHREGYLEAREIHVGRFRRTKMAVSAAAAAVVFALLWRRFAWDRAQGGFGERRRGG